MIESQILEEGPATASYRPDCVEDGQPVPVFPAVVVVLFLEKERQRCTSIQKIGPDHVTSSQGWGQVFG
jgi:hypothetical protein